MLLIDYNLFQIVNDEAFFISVNRCLLLTGYESVPMSESASLFRNLMECVIGMVGLKPIGRSGWSAFVGKDPIDSLSPWKERWNDG